MAISGAIKVDCAEVFPHGLGVVGEVAPLADFNASTKENRVQARDKESGLPMWQVEVLDFDQQAREKTYRVKIAAAVQPVPPDMVSGVPVRPVMLENLTITPYIADGRGRGSPTACGAPASRPLAAGPPTPGRPPDVRPGSDWAGRRRAADVGTRLLPGRGGG